MKGIGSEIPEARFGPTPQIMITPGAEKAFMTTTEPGIYLDRHFTGDWGEIGDEDKAQNDLMVEEQGMILSAYTTKAGVKIWIITDAGHETTTMLLPDEY